MKVAFGDIVVEILNSNLISALIGFGAALLVFFLTEKKQRERILAEDSEKYVVSLQATQNEIKFYGSKLQFLSEQLNQILNCLRKGSFEYATPSYSFYPSFLEKSKADLSSFFRNSHLVHEVGHCHFELCHILERMDWLKSLPRHVIPSQVENIGGMKMLVDSNIPVFTKTVELIQSEIDQVQR